MEQKSFFKNVTSTACVVGLALTTMSLNSTLLVSGNDELPMANYYNVDETSSQPLLSAVSNIYIDKRERNIDLEAEKMFGRMRDATQEEQECISKYINNIAEDTGVNFFDLC